MRGSSLERDPEIVSELWEISPIQPGDVFVIASNSGVNGSVVGMALSAKERGHDVIAVTSLQHTARVRPKHPSGLRLSEVADVVIDNLAPYGDATLALPGGVAVGSVSSITSAFIAQLLTIGVVEQMSSNGRMPPLYLSANIPGGDKHNHALEKRYRAVRQHGETGRLSSVAPDRLDNTRSIRSKEFREPNRDRSEGTSDGHQHRSLGRRDFLRGSLAAAALAATGSLAACATSGTGTSTASSPAAEGAVSDTNPFGVQSGSTVDAVIFKGGYGIDYAEFAGKQVQAKQSGCDGEGHAHHQGRPDTAAPLRCGRPAGRYRQQRRRPDRDQYDPRPAGRADRRHRGQELRGHGHQGHAVRRRHRARNVRWQVHCAELRPHRVRHLVLCLALRGERLDRSQDVRRDVGPRRRGQGQGQVCARLG